MADRPWWDPGYTGAWGGFLKGISGGIKDYNIIRLGELGERRKRQKELEDEERAKAEWERRYKIEHPGLTPEELEAQQTELQTAKEKLKVIQEGEKMSEWQRETLPYYQQSLLAAAAQKKESVKKPINVTSIDNDINEVLSKAGKAFMTQPELAQVIYAINNAKNADEVEEIYFTNMGSFSTTVYGDRELSLADLEKIKNAKIDRFRMLRGETIPGGKTPKPKTDEGKREDILKKWSNQ